MCVCGIHDYQSAGKNAGRGNSEVSLTQREITRAVSVSFL